jgi:hypothetical protein
MHPRNLFLVPGFLFVSALMACSSDEQSPTRSAATTLPTIAVTCTGSSFATYEPGLKNTPQKVTRSATVTFPDCKLLPSLQHTSAISPLKVQSLENFRCTDILKPLSETEAIVSWAEGGTSKVSLNQTRAEAQGLTTVLISVGSVADGKYKGAVATRTLTYVNADVEKGCLSEQGLKQTTGLATLVLALPQ